MSASKLTLVTACGNLQLCRKKPDKMKANYNPSLKGSLYPASIKRWVLLLKKTKKVLKLPPKNLKIDREKVEEEKVG